MYLPVEVTRQTLGLVSGLSAPGSRVVISYMAPGELPLPDAVVRAALASLRVAGEPLVGEITPPAMAAMLDAAGFAAERDENSLDWASRYAGSARLPVLYRQERVVVAVRGALSPGPGPSGG
jgi:O-methyltransferase involved in polyketide biosynthesis